MYVYAHARTSSNLLLRCCKCMKYIYMRPSSASESRPPPIFDIHKMIGPRLSVRDRKLQWNVEVHRSRLSDRLWSLDTPQQPHRHFLQKWQKKFSFVRFLDCSGSPALLILTKLAAVQSSRFAHHWKLPQLSLRLLRNCACSRAFHRAHVNLDRLLFTAPVTRAPCVQ
jgi:hypothetical protein